MIIVGQQLDKAAQQSTDTDTSSRSRTQQVVLIPPLQRTKSMPRRLSMTSAPRRARAATSCWAARPPLNRLPHQRISVARTAQMGCRLQLGRGFDAPAGADHFGALEDAACVLSADPFVCMPDIEAQLHQAGNDVRCARMDVSCPTVATRFVRASVRFDSQHELSSAASASRRPCIGTVPAWPASPVNLISSGLTAIAVTTRRAARCAREQGPARYGPRVPSGLPAFHLSSATCEGSPPKAFTASAREMPSASTWSRIASRSCLQPRGSE